MRSCAFKSQTFIGPKVFLVPIFLVIAIISLLLLALVSGDKYIAYAILIMGVAVAFLNFEVAFIFFCVGILYGSAFYDLFFTISAILFVILTISYFLSGNLIGKSISFWKDNALKKVVLLFLLWELLQLILSLDFLTPRESLKAVIEIVVPVAIFFIIAFYTRNWNRVIYIIAILLICAVSEATLGILQHFSEGFYITPTNIPRDSYSIYPREYLGYILPFISRYVREARGTFGQLNGLGNFLTFFTPLVFAIALVQEKKFNIKRIFFWFVGVNIFLGLYFTYSRGSLIGVLIGLLIIFLLIKKRRLKIIILLLGIALLLIVWYQSIPIADNISEYWHSTQNLKIRIIIWNDTLSHIMRSPSTILVGYHYFGSTDYKSIYQKYNWIPGGHNAYLSIWEAKGLVGLFLIISMLILSMKGLYLAYKEVDNAYIKHICLGLLAGLIAFSISQVFDHKLAYFFDIRTYFFIILGISAGIKKILESHQLIRKTRSQLKYAD